MKVAPLSRETLKRFPKIASSPQIGKSSRPTGRLCLRKGKPLSNVSGLRPPDGNSFADGFVLSMRACFDWLPSALSFRKRP